MSVKMELASLVSGAITNAPKQIEFLPVNAVLLEGVRQNDKRPAWIKISVPDAWVVNLMKNEKLLDGFIMVKIEREFIGWHIFHRLVDPHSPQPLPFKL